MQRCFIAFELPDLTRQALAHVQAEMLAIDEPGASIKPTALENLHLTLKFLGPTSDTQQETLMAALKSVADTHAPVQASVLGLSAFALPAQPRSIYGVVPEGQQSVLSLMGALSDACADVGFEPDGHARVPHVTLARLNRVDPRGRLCDWLAQAPAHRYGPVTGDFFTLFRSTLRPQGSLYEPLARFALRG